MTRRFVATLGCLLAACQDVEAPPGTWVGEYVDYGQSVGLRPCAGTHAYTDGFVPFLAGELGLEPVQSTFRWLDTEGYETSGCPESSAGCARGSLAQSRDPFYAHEQVHTFGAAYGMNGLSFYTEGLAVAYDWLHDSIGPRYVYTPEDRPLPDPRPWMTLPRTEFDYGLAGAFVAFLLSRHGPEKFIAVSQRARFGDDLATLERDFAEVYGVELAVEAELFTRNRDLPCDGQVFDLRPYDCSMPEIPWSGDTWVHAGILECDADDVAGGLGPDRSWPSVRSVTLTVPTSGMYRLRRYGDEGVAVQLGSCFGCPWAWEDHGASDGAGAPVSLTAGTYFVRVVAASDAAPLVGVVLTREE